MRAAAEPGRELVLSYGGRAVGYLIDLRNPFAAGRPVRRDDLPEVYRYQEREAIWQAVDRSIEGGLLTESSDGVLAPTDRGKAFLTDLFALHSRVLAERWGGQVTRVSRLNDRLARLLAEAAATAGPAWRVQAPPHEPPEVDPGVWLLNRLSTLRYHRADAHAAAWQAAGLTAAEMVALPPGPAREAIEHDTDVRAAAPYRLLSPDERLELLADLAALP